MSSNRACNSSFWTKEENKIFENTLAIYFNDEDLLAKMAEALPGKSREDILNHYNILVEDVTAIESGCVPKEKRRRRSILDITSADAEVAGTSQAVPSTNNESLLPQQMTAFAGGESSGNNAAFANSMNCLYPDVNDKFMEQEVANESGFLAVAGRSISEQPFTVASSGTSSHPITRIGSELEALITEHKDEDNDINSIFDVGKAPASHAMLYNAAHGGSSSSTVASSGSSRSRHTHQGSK